MKKQIDQDPDKRVTIVDKNGRVTFTYPKHFTNQQRGITISRGLGRNMSRIKAPRIVSPEEAKNVAAAKKDVGTKTQKQFSSIAQRRVPRALYAMYGLPMRNKTRPESQLAKFMKSLI